MKFITLEGNPISTQHAYANGNGRRFLTTKARALKEDYQWQVKQQWDNGMLEGDLSVDIILYFGDERKRDFDNFHKLSIDSLEGIVFKDDAQITEATVIKAIDKKRPRIEIRIWCDNMCQTCGKICKSASWLTRHMQTEHEID